MAPLTGVQFAVLVIGDFEASRQNGGKERQEANEEVQEGKWGKV
jgi:hypothetical protein